MHAWHWYGETEISLRGATAGPDRGQVFYKGRPLCNAGAGNNDGTWDINAANVICKMLGFNTATNSHHNSPFGASHPAGNSFAMSGIRCTGSKTHILDCPHDATVSSSCGTDGLTSGSTNDIVAVECAYY